MEFTKETVDGVCVCRLTGPLDLGVVDDLRGELHQVAEAGAGAVVVDMTNVAFICSGCLGALIAFRQGLSRTDGKLAMCGLSGTIHKLFKISRLDRFFDIAASEAAALAAVRD